MRAAFGRKPTEALDMSLEIPASFSPAVQQLISEGRYQNEGEVVSEGIRLLLKQEQLWKDVKAGIDQLEAGERVPAEQVYSEARNRVQSVEQHRGS